MYLVADRNGKTEEENSLQDKLLRWMYGHLLGRCLLKPLIMPGVSRLGGKLLDLRMSRVLVAPFVHRLSIDMTDYEQKEYVSYNDFFKRRLRPGARQIENAPEILVSPCDSRLSVYKVGSESTFKVKHTSYTLSTLLRDWWLADQYAGGYVWIFRLRVDDCHRYIYVDCGKESKRRVIPGVFHTVNPAAGDRFPIYKENTREYSVLKSENFGEILQMEVGALLVGQIENHRVSDTVKRGQEKGSFAFGGSTIILMTRKGRVCPDQDILENSAKGIETRVKLGERVGIKNFEKPFLDKSRFHAYN
ncbi:phosphatidylserine decarboxylase [Lachnospiraceae bacterium 48-42]|nr:phosphatidylserine decarboxylase [Dorea sp.]